MKAEEIGLTESHLAAALKAARKGAGEGGHLWLLLLAGVGGNEFGLRKALLHHHGVAVLGQDELASARVEEVPVANDPSQHLRQAWINLAGRPVLLCRDPWSPQALFAANSRPGAQLALAVPGQLEKLGAPVGQSNASHAVVKAGIEPAGDSPVIGFVDDAIGRAYQDGASDIHFETDRRGVGVKYRIDGVMAPGERFDDPVRAEEILSRIKVMAQLDITERRRPQDGRIHWQSPEVGAIDLRVSVMPSIFGEDAVLRLLDKAQLRHSQATVSLGSLGFEEAIARRIRALASRPHGMLLVTGPTGSGKTTTVYAALSEVNDGLEKIITIEDPVEYELPGVLQIPVNEKKGLTFATGLRSILRHDPDKILVGEIRDAETAEIAVQSSLTGHLVMTTVHANSLFDVLGRFQHFGIDPFGLASALNGVVVQRLLRKLCLQCRSARSPETWQRDLYAKHGLDCPEHLPAATGCTHCRGSGYKGRLVVAEVHELADIHRDLIVSKAPLSEMKASIYGRGGDTLLARALGQVAQGITSIEEIRRVVGLDEHG
jgi:general secretion pathway protein E